MISAQSCVVSAPAKINLCLHVGEKRTDGYHDLESLVAFASCGDEITIDSADELSLSVAGPYSRMLPPRDDNLAWKAARLLSERTEGRAGARITLRKNLPLASGLGGGSADAAAVLRGLQYLWNVDLDREVLHDIASSLGADVPVCMRCAAAFIEGRGEKISFVPPLPEAPLILVNPAIPVSTASVFANLQGPRGLGLPLPMAPFESMGDLVDFLRSTTNDLQAPACRIAPAISEVLAEIKKIPDLLFARMSGSGATCFGLFASGTCAGSAISWLKNRHPSWWVVRTAFAPSEAGAPRPIQ